MNTQYEKSGFKYLIVTFSNKAWRALEIWFRKLVIVRWEYA